MAYSGAFSRKSLQKGFSLLETIISFFIIVGALLIVVQLFHTSLQHGRIVEERLTGASLAERKLEEIRAWALDPDNFENGWGTYNGQVSSFPGFSDYSIRTTLTDVPRATPNTLMESAHPPADQKVLANVLKGVTIDCTWGPDPNQTIRLTSLVSAPPRAWRNPIALEITGSTAALARDATATFSVKGFDDAGHELTDLTFNWVVVPKGGNGVVAPLPTSRRDGKVASLGNWLEAPVGGRFYRPGEVEFTAIARYNGVESKAFVVVNLL